MGKEKTKTCLALIPAEQAKSRSGHFTGWVVIRGEASCQSVLQSLINSLLVYLEEGLS